MHHQTPLFLALRLSVWRFQMPLERLSFVKTLVTFELLENYVALRQTANGKDGL